MKHVVPALLAAFLIILPGCAEVHQEVADQVHPPEEPPPPPPADPADVASIDAIMKAYYEVVSGAAGEIPDKQRDLSLHHPDHWIAISGADAEGNGVVNIMDLDGFYGDLAPRAEAFYEWETDREVRQHGQQAHVWSHYATARTPDGEPYATGVNSIQLWNDGERWWIMNWMFDTTEGR